MQTLESLYQIADELPCADFGLLRPLKRSSEYASLRHQVANPKPLDAWQAEMLHYFIFQLKPITDQGRDPISPIALFTMRWEDDSPVAALIVTSIPERQQAQVVDLRRLDSPLTVDLSYSDASASDNSVPASGS